MRHGLNKEMDERKSMVLEPADGSARDRTPACCPCGALQCYLTERGVEIKCKKCKRVVVVPLSSR